jgi:hypothetical protein
VEVLGGEQGTESVGMPMPPLEERGGTQRGGTAQGQRQETKKLPFAVFVVLPS